MTKTEALFNFWNGFELDAYPTSSVPEEENFPYLSYESIVGNSGDPSVSSTVNLWFHTSSEAVPNAKAEEISEKIGLGGIQIPYSDGAIWIKRGTPWCVAESDATDPQIKLRRLNIEITFM